MLKSSFVITKSSLDKTILVKKTFYPLQIFVKVLYLQIE